MENKTEKSKSGNTAEGGAEKSKTENTTEIAAEKPKSAEKAAEKSKDGNTAAKEGAVKLKDVNTVADEAEKSKSDNTAAKEAEKSKSSNIVAATSEEVNTGNPLEDGFEKLKREGKNTVDNLIQWMKDSKIIPTPELETKARKLFEGVADRSNVELEKFKEVVSSMTAGTKFKLEGIANTLLSNAPRFLGAFGAATSAFKDALERH